MHKYATVFCTSSVSVLEVNVNRDLCLSVVGSGCGCGGGEVGGGGEAGANWSDRENCPSKTRSDNKRFQSTAHHWSRVSTTR